MFEIKWPWTKRADDEERLRRHAELRRHEVEQDWEALRETTDAISSEVELNDWTRTALTIFQGKGVHKKKQVGT